MDYLLVGSFIVLFNTAWATRYIKFDLEGLDSVDEVVVSMIYSLLIILWPITLYLAFCLFIVACLEFVVNKLKGK